MKKIIAAVLVVWCCNTLAGDLPDLGEPTLGRYELSKGQIAAETAYMALLYVDYRQTMDIKRSCSRPHDGQDSLGYTWASNNETCGMYETNPFLGRRPSDAKIRNYFALSAVTHVAITKALPSEYRPYWQGAGIVFQLYTVIKNRQLGLSVNF